MENMAARMRAKLKPIHKQEEASDEKLLKILRLIEEAADNNYGSCKVFVENIFEPKELMQSLIAKGFKIDNIEGEETSCFVVEWADMKDYVQSPIILTISTK